MVILHFCMQREAIIEHTSVKYHLLTFNMQEKRYYQAYKYKGSFVHTFCQL